MKKYITVQTAKREIEQGFILDSMIFGELMQFKDGNMDVDDLIHEINVQAIEEAKNSLEEVEPEEDVTPVIHAHWIENEDCSVVTDIPWSMCSACGEYSLKLPYCAFCGAKMDEGGRD